MQEKLQMWQERLARCQADYQSKLDKMDRRENLYRGDRSLTPITGRECRGGEKTPHVRNIVAENVESQISSDIPQPKVTARRQKDEPLAKLIEDMLRNELDRLPMEYLNDMQERTVPIQGGGFFHVEWDSRKRSHGAAGEIAVSLRHPKQIIPQAGVYTGIEDMDYLILKLPQTREAVQKRYGVKLTEEGEREPELRGAEGESPAQDMLTLYTAYYRNSSGGIGVYSWVWDRELEDIEDYQARRLRRCARCGDPEPEGGGKCPNCGASQWESRAEEFEEIWTPVATERGTVIPGASVGVGEDGFPVLTPTRVPYYKPNVYPIVMQRNVSVFGQLLGESDVDKIEDQQNTANRLEKKILDRIMKAGSRILMPGQARHRIDETDNEVWYLENIADASMIQVKDFTGNLQYEIAQLGQVYEEARQALGITDSFQGRRDATATSGVAKQFAAAQSAGRLESKRAMKNAAYADLFRIIFQFKLAYADEPRPVVSQDSKGNKTYSAFNRYDFLERDENTGEWFWNDQFLFSTDSAAPLASNRERMWEETVSLFSAGCFGNPAQLDTLVALWTKLELLHYPGAGDTRAYLEGKLEQQQAAMQQQAALEQAALEQTVGGGSAPVGAAALSGPPESSPVTANQALADSIDQKARRDAMNAVLAGDRGIYPQENPAEF